MKVTLLKISRKKEVINRLDLQEMADLIRQNPEQNKVATCIATFVIFCSSVF